MPRFQKYLRYNPYYDPERVDKIVTRLEKQTHPLSQPQKTWLEQNRSRVAKNRAYSSTTTNEIVNADTMSRQKARSLLAAFTERDFADPQKRKAYRDLRNIELGTARGHGPHDRHAKPMDETLKAGGSPKNVSSPSGANKKYYDPTGKDYAVTTSGNLARAKGWAMHHFVPGYHLASKVLPCIQTKERREVMFANKDAGKGYKVKHRNKPGRIPC